MVRCAGPWVGLGWNGSCCQSKASEFRPVPKRESDFVMAGFRSARVGACIEGSVCSHSRGVWVGVGEQGFVAAGEADASLCGDVASSGQSRAL